MGGSTVLFLPRPPVPLPHHGVPSRWRSYDHAHQIRYILGRCVKILHCSVYFGHRGRSPDGFHSSVWNNHTALPVIESNILSSDIKPDNILIDKDGHIKLSDFGLSTGFHKQHDSSYYAKLLESGSSELSPAATAQKSRNSVMVNAIHLTMTSKDQIATWKANRRKLVCSIACEFHHTHTLL